MYKPVEFNVRRKAVLTHILNSTGITRTEALTAFGIQNLAQVIMELRRRGWQISKRKDRFASGIALTQYYITLEEYQRKRSEGKCFYSVARNKIIPVL